MSFSAKDVEVTAVRCKMLDLHVRKYLTDISPQAAMTANLAEIYDYIIGGMCLELRAWILKSEHAQTPNFKTVTFTCPKGRIDHLKMAIFPKWLIKIFPPKLIEKSETVRWMEGPTYVCPHSNVAWPDRRHLEFMLYGPIDLRKVL